MLLFGLSATENEMLKWRSDSSVVFDLSDTAMYNTTLAPPKTGLTPNTPPGQ